MKVWKDISGYEGLYQVSSSGDVRSLDRTSVTSNGVIRKDKGCVLAAKCGQKGYKYVALSSGGQVKNYLLHRLVAFAFIPTKDDKCFVNHKDGNKSNNTVGNLEWVSAKENIRHAIDIGLIQRHKDQYLGIYKPVYCVELDMDFDSIASAITFLKEHGHNAARDSKISECVSGKRRSAYGLTWKELTNEGIYA